MLRIFYKKTDKGPVIVDVREVSDNRGSQDVIELYESFFNGVPIWGRGWEKFEVDEIVKIFHEAAVEIHKSYKRIQEDELKRHNNARGITRWFRIRFKKKSECQPPYIPSVKEIINEMAARCRSLSMWMEKAQHRPFYASSDMSCYIVKPLQVAERLLQMAE